MCSSKFKNKSQYEIDFLPTGLHECMSAVILEDDTVNLKPHLEPLEKIINILGVKVENCIYIGGPLSDSRCSKACNMDFGLALWGVKGENKINSDIFLQKPEDLLELI